MKTGLLFGSFNPIHKGHLGIAEFMAGNTDLEEVWFIVSPQNPFKEENDLLEEGCRLSMVKAAIKGNPRLKACDVEFQLPKPSYTINTLSFLIQKHPVRQFALIMGQDNLVNFHRWKDYEKIISGFQIYVYPREAPDNETPEISNEILHPNIQKFDLNLLDISSTEIRRRIKNREDVSAFLSEGVWEEIKEKKYYF